LDDDVGVGEGEVARVEGGSDHDVAGDRKRRRDVDPDVVGLAQPHVDGDLRDGDGLLGLVSDLNEVWSELVEGRSGSLEVDVEEEAVVAPSGGGGAPVVDPLGGGRLIVESEIVDVEVGVAVPELDGDGLTHRDALGESDGRRVVVTGVDGGGRPLDADSFSCSRSGSG
jgi:hypothetical protein